MWTRRPGQNQLNFFLFSIYLYKYVSLTYFSFMAKQTKDDSFYYVQHLDKDLLIWMTLLTFGGVVLVPVLRFAGGAVLSFVICVKYSDKNIVVYSIPVFPWVRACACTWVYAPDYVHVCVYKWTSDPGTQQATSALRHIQGSLQQREHRWWAVIRVPPVFQYLFHMMKMTCAVRRDSVSLDFV